MFKNTIGRLLGKSEFQPSLETSVPPLVELDERPLLRLSLCQGSAEPLKTNVTADDTVTAGQVLAGDGKGFFLTSPVAGTIKAITEQPDIRGCRKGSAIILEPSKEAAGATAFAPLDPLTSDPATLAERVREAGILASMQRPVPLSSLLCRNEGEKIDTLIVLAADRDPGVSVALHRLREHSAEALAAAQMLGRIAGAEKVILAVLASEAGSVHASGGVEILSLPAKYPQTLDTLVARRAGGTDATITVPLESALDALAAVREGQVQRSKLLTVIGKDQQPVANYRVPLGTQIREVLSHAGIEPGERDKVLAGGPMRGFALFSLDGAIDAGVDALTVIPAESVIEWSSSPCINCGRCIDICPINLQVQLISRYAEFELFDRTEELEIGECFECGLCASVCTARRPLLQLIRLAKRELEETA